MFQSVFYIFIIVLLFLLNSLSVLSDECSFVLLNIFFSAFVISKLLEMRHVERFIINPLFLASLFMFLFAYGFPILGEYFQGEIRYGCNFHNLFKGMLYVNFAFLVLWHTYHSQWLSRFAKSLNRTKFLYRKELKLNMPIIYVVIIVSICANLITIHKGQYGVLATNDPSLQDIEYSQLNYFLSIGLKGVVFLLALQYYKYRKNKILFISTFGLLLFFQILAGFKGAIIQTFLLLFIANYIVNRKVNFRLLFLSFFSLIVAYSVVEPYRAYLDITKSQPSSVFEISDCIVKGVIVGAEVVKEDDENSLLVKVLSRFSSLPELATFIDYKEKYGLIEGRDPNFINLCLTIPAQLLIPRAIWSSKPVNDLGVWWVSNTVIGNMSNSSSAFGPIGFLYLTAGFISIAIGFIIIAIILKIGEKLMNMDCDGSLLISIIYLTNIYTMEAAFNIYVIGAIRFLFIAYVFHLIIMKPAKV